MHIGYSDHNIYILRSQALPLEARLTGYWTKGSDSRSPLVESQDGETARLIAGFGCADLIFVVCVVQ